ncbi:MAG: hypothetical protein IKU29_07285 [Parabacteroides sp.]|nr:hypothetical protein [Parabacteroides sp.]
MSNIFERLLSIITTTNNRLKRIEDAVKNIQPGGGGGGNATIEDYTPGKFYPRNTLVVDPLTETVYRTLPREGYTSTTLANDIANERIKLVGYESQIINLDHNPTQEEINTLPSDATVLVYSPQDDPYTPALSSDNFNE